LPTVGGSWESEPKISGPILVSKKIKNLFLFLKVYFLVFRS